MPLFQRKPGKVDSTRYWIGDTRFPLELDLDKHALSGAPVGGTLDPLQRLGAAEDTAKAVEGVYAYYSKGLEFTAEEGFISGFRFIFAPAEGFRPFPGDILMSGHKLPITAETSEEELLHLIGAPYWRDQDEEELLLFHEYEKVEWQIEFAKGRLSQWSIVSPPLMASAEGRAAYNVTHPWPPEQGSKSQAIRPKWADQHKT